MLAGGIDYLIVPAGVGGFISLMELSQRNDDPYTMSIPWDKYHERFVMCDGPGMLVSLN